MVQFQQAMSESMLVTSGVTQDSILGPLLLIILMNNLPLEIENCNLDIYADDSTLEANAKTVEQLKQKDCTSCRREQLEWFLTSIPKHLLSLSLKSWTGCLWLTDRVEYRWAILVHKSINGTAPEYIRQMFKFVMNVSQRNTWYVDNFKLYLPSGYHLKVFTDTFKYAACAAWNKLPVQVQEVNSIAAFRAAYMKWYVSQTWVPWVFKYFMWF